MTELHRLPFGVLSDGRQVTCHVLKNDYLSVSVLDYGLRLSSVKVKRRQGNPQETVLGFNSLKDYEQDQAYIGAVIGRYANRIRNGRYRRGGVETQLVQNHGRHHLHGGVVGFHNQVWESHQNGSGLEFSLVSPDGESGFPGNLRVVVRLSVEDNYLRYEYSASSDKETPVNFSNHAYFNLNGRDQGVGLHQLKIDADSYLPVDDELLPLGNLVPVSNTPFDFRESKLISQDIDAHDQQLTRGTGYDHCYALNNPGCVELLSLENGLRLTVSTSEPGVQLYTANHLPKPRTAVCLETQHFPDSPNQEGFPSVWLMPGKQFQSSTTYQFEFEELMR